MVPFGTARRNQFITHSDRKRQIRQPASMQVTKLPPPHSKLDPTEPVGLDAHTRPARDFALDLF